MILGLAHPWGDGATHIMPIAFFLLYLSPLHGLFTSLSMKRLKDESSLYTSDYGLLALQKSSIPSDGRLPSDLEEAGSRFHLKTTGE